MQYVLCVVCGEPFDRAGTILKNRGFLCVVCAHQYELEIFTPPDHSAAECELCTMSTGELFQ
jgi:hypothetical protein